MDAVGLVGWILFAITALFVVVVFGNTKFNCLPHIFLRMASNDIFLQEYDRRADEVVQQTSRIATRSAASSARA